MNKESILNEFTVEKVALRIKKLRVQSGMSVLDLASKTYLTTSAVYKILNAKCIPNVTTLVYFSLAFNCSIDYILLGKID